MKADHPHKITEKFIAEYFKISLEEAGEIQKKLEFITYKNDEAIVTIGEPADGLYFLEDGQATVYNGEGEAVNEMGAGQCFGEYAVLTEEPRMTTVKAHGKVEAYRMTSEDFLEVVARHPKLTGRLFRQVYDQVSAKHTKLVSLTRKNRGVMWSPERKKDAKLSRIIVTYGATFLVFLGTFLAARFMQPQGVWWQLLPVIFLMAFTIRTKRIVEGMLLTVILLACMLYQGNLLLGFEELLTEGIGNTNTAETIVIMAMVESVAALLASAGVVSAFQKLAEKRVKSKPGSLFSMLLIMMVVCLDECLNVLTAGFCLNAISDKHRIPRESRAVLGSFSTAICSLIPFSLWGAYISGWISMYSDNGNNVFLRSIPFNLVGVFGLIFAILLCLGMLPKTKQMQEAYKRVEQGGKLWPEGSERYFEVKSADAVVGRPINLILPMLVWSVSSVVCGIIRDPGGFAMDPISGLVITLFAMFLLYVGQRMMTPKSFFEIMAGGIQNALIPILLLVFAERISACLEELGFNVFLETAIPALVGGHLFLVPMVIFVLCTLLGLGIRSCWGMYGLGIPIAVYLSTGLGLSLPLCLGAALAAGIIGESLCPYVDETSPVVISIGCGPMAYRRLRMQYWIPLGLLCAGGYLVLGLIFV